jgi:hypothetical protein
MYPPDRFWVISLAEMEEILPNVEKLMSNLGNISPNEILEHFVLRAIQRACVLSILPSWHVKNGSHCKKLEDRLNHSNTVGCLFDYTHHLADARYFVKCGFICESCGGAILEAEELEGGHRNDFLHAIQSWIEKTTMDSGSVNQG